MMAPGNVAGIEAFFLSMTVQGASVKQLLIPYLHTLKSGLVLVAPSKEGPCNHRVILSLRPLLHIDGGKQDRGITPSHSPINPVIGAIIEQMLGNK